MKSNTLKHSNIYENSTLRRERNKIFRFEKITRDVLILFYCQ